MENLSFGNFEVGDIVGHWSEVEGKMINSFLILRKEGCKYFGLQSCLEKQECSDRYLKKFRGEEIELKNPTTFLKEYSINLKQDVNTHWV